jgi:hypothetical protein
MVRAIQFACFLALGFVVSVQTGCTKADTATETTAGQSGDHADDGHDHDGHDHANMNFGAAIAELEELTGTISQSMAKDDADAAHDPLHEVGDLLEALPELAKKEGLSKDDQKSVNGAVAKLMDAYGSVDAIMHGEEGKSWDDVKGDIDEATKTLTAFEHDHDHGDHDHGDGDHDHGDHDHGDHDHGDHDHGDEDQE